VEKKFYKHRVHEIIEKAETGDKVSEVFDYFIVGLIILNVLAIILESFSSIYYPYRHIFSSFELFSVIIFTVEYLLRIWTSDYIYQSASKTKTIFRFIITPMALVDLFAILPFYLPMLIPFDLRFLRLLRIIRFLRLFKLNRYSNSLRLVGKVLEKKKSELFITLIVTLILLLIASTLMYYLESKVQPNAFPNILASLWWAISTLTTVGYGDVYPVTVWGRILSGSIAFLGIGLVALPTGILSSGFMEELRDQQEEENIDEREAIKYCPYCGEKIK